MTCPYRSDGSNRDGEGSGSGDGTLERGMDRRSFMRSALFIGGSALASTTALYGMPENTRAEHRDNPTTIADRLNRQHAWNDYTAGTRGTNVPPENHLVLVVDYERAGEPTAEDRKEVAAALDQLEEAIEWNHDGLLFTIGYSLSYFDRFDEELPVGMQPNNDTATPRMFSGQQIIDGITVPNPTKVDADGEPEMFDLNVTLEKEDPVADDHYDAVIHMASDHVPNLLAAEQALWGEQDDLNGVDFTENNLDGIFTKPEEYPERRTGFAGSANLDEKIDAEDFDDVGAGETFEEHVDSGADLSMGYNALFKNSQPREDNATVLEDQNFIPFQPQPPGVFAGGSIQHVSKINTDLEGWYRDNSESERRARMFSSHHTEADVGKVGENLGRSSAPSTTTDLPMLDRSQEDTTDVAERTLEDAESGRHIGHAQKIARARANLEAHFEAEGDRDLLQTGVPLQDDPVAQRRDDNLPNHDGVQELKSGMIRRDFNTLDDTGENESGVHFIALQAFSSYIIYQRHAMNHIDWETGIVGTEAGEGRQGFDHEGDIEIERNGIIEYLDTKRRGNFILPPIKLRALPFPRAERPEITVDHTGNSYRVTVADTDLAESLDLDTVRFGYYRTVNAGAGAAPSDVERNGDGVTFVFPESQLEEIELQFEKLPEGEVKLRLFGKRESDDKPVHARARLAHTEYRLTLGGDYSHNPVCEYEDGESENEENQN